MLAGWLANNLKFAVFGEHGFLMQPWTTIGWIGLSLSLFCAASNRPLAARCLTFIPLAIAWGALAQQWPSLSLELDQWLLPDAILHQARFHQGRPGISSGIVMLLFTLALLAATSSHSATKRLGVSIALLATAFAIVSSILPFYGITSIDEAARRPLTSIPTTFIIIALSLAIAFHERLNATRQTCRTPAWRWAFLLSVTIPFATAFWHISVHSNSGTMPEIVRSMLQIALSCAIMRWVWLWISQESTARWAFDVAMDSVPIAIIDANGRIAHWSKGCERLYGWTAQEACGQYKHILTNAALPPGSSRSFALNCPSETEFTEQSRDGTHLHVLETRQIIQPRPDLDPLVILSITDITARQQAEQACLASEARHAFAADLQGLGVFEWSGATDEMQFSPHAERLFGLDGGGFDGGLEKWRHHIINRFGTDILEHERLPPVHFHRIFFRICSAGQNGPRIVEGSIFFYQPPAEQAFSMLGIVMDVTEREQRTEMLQARESELSSILETIPEAMITIDEAGRVRSFSMAAEKLFGYASEEIVGQDIRMVLPDYAKAAASTQSTFANEPWLPKMPQSQNTAGYDRQGNEMPVELAVSETTIGNEHISIAFVRNLREQIAIQSRLNELRDQLLHASRVSAMGEMGAGLAHELNQPLTASANFLGAATIRLDTDADRDQIRQLIELANHEVLRAGEIIRRMRAFVAKGELDIRAFPLNELIADALQLAWSGWRHTNVHLSYQPDLSAPSVLADHIQIQQVLVNIIHNSLETFATHGTQNPEIAILTEDRGNGTVLIRLLDNGPGFPASIIGRPFEAFVSTRENGLGLGLSICRRIVEGHGGTLSFANRPEGGARIEFTLPIYPEKNVKAGGARCDMCLS